MSIRQKDEKVQPHAPDSKLKQTLIDIFAEFSTGTASQLDLSRKFQEKKLRDYKDRLITFSPQTMNNLLNNPYYAGMLRHEDGHLIRGKHEAVIDYSLFLKCQEILNRKSNNSRGTRNYDNPEFPLKSFVKCGECGDPLTAQFSNSQNSGKYPHYFCFNSKCGQFRKTYRRADLENDFARYLPKIKPTDEFV